MSEDFFFSSQISYLHQIPKRENPWRASHENFFFYDIPTWRVGLDQLVVCGLFFVLSFLCCSPSFGWSSWSLNSQLQMHFSFSIGRIYHYLITYILRPAINFWINFYTSIMYCFSYLWLSMCIAHGPSLVISKNKTKDIKNEKHWRI